jgi:hypothetical protein
MMRIGLGSSLGLLCGALLGATAPSPAVAQLSSTTPDPYSIFTPAPTPAETRDANAPIGVAQRFQADLQSGGSWIDGQHVVASATLSSLYDSNIFATAAAPTGDVVSHFRPTLDLDNGQQEVSYTFNIYSDLAEYASHPSLNNNNAGAAFGVSWEIAPTFLIQSHTTFVYGHADPASFVLPVANAAISHLPDTESFDQEFAATRDVGRWALSLSGGYARTQESDLTLGGAQFALSALDTDVVNAASRLAYDLTPDLRSFVRAEYRHEIDANGAFNAGTYSLVTGLDFDLRSLIKGSIDVGYREHVYDTSGFGSVGTPTYGVNLAWYPTELLTLTLTGSQDFSDSILPRSGGTAPGGAGLSTENLVGVPVISNLESAQIQIDYEVAQGWMLSSTTSYKVNNYTSSHRQDDIVTTGATLLYSINPSLVTSAQYRYSRQSSTVSGIGYDRDQVGLAIKYRF